MSHIGFKSSPPHLTSSLVKSHIEKRPIYAPLLLTVSQWGPHRYSQFHGWPPHFKMSISNHSFPHWQGGVKRLPVEKSVLRNGNKMQICDILLYFVSKTIYKMSIQKLCEFHRFFQTTGSGLGRVPCPPHPSKMADVTVDRTPDDR